MDLALLIIAGLGAVAIVVGHLFRRFVPEIVVFLALGLAIGPDGIGLINADNIDSLDLLTNVALGAVVFLIGERLHLEELRERRRLLLPLNLGHIVLSFLLVVVATLWVGARVELAVLLGLIATESGVLTVTATIKEERAKGPTSDTLLASLGVTNVATAVMFGLALPFVLASTGAAEPRETVLVFVQLVLVSSAIGLVGGWILKTFAGMVPTSGELLLLVVVVLTGVVGAAVAVAGSVVVAGLVAGLYVANAVPWLAERLFAAIRTLESPIYLVFFVVAGAGIHLDELAQVGVFGLVYVAARTVGKVAGATLGGWIGRDARTGWRVGTGLLPHAGMAIALVALVVEQAPELGPPFSAIILGSIVVFELAGPLATRRALRAAGEAGRAGGAQPTPDLLPDVITERTFDRVLVPVASIDVVMPRLPFLLDLVGTMHAELVAVHISRPGSDSARENEPEVLRLVESVATERGLVVHTVHRVNEDVAQAIVATAEEQGVDLVVLGEPARTSLLEPSRWGLISQRVVRDVTVPVLVYPVDPTDPDRVPEVYLRRAAGEQAQAQARRDQETTTVEEPREA